MNLSEVADAMEKGLNGYEQMQGGLIEIDWKTDEVKAVCALGALGLGCNKTPEQLEILGDIYWPQRTRRTLRSTSCPALGNDCATPVAIDYAKSIPSNVAHLNDVHEWTVAQIATWLRSL